MIGLYLGCNSNSLISSKKEFTKLQQSTLLPEWLNIDGELIYHKSNKAPQIKYVKDEHRFLCISGWFLYKDKLNDIKSLFEDLSRYSEEALNNITGGVFIALYSSNTDYFVFNDPMGFSNHYYITEQNDFCLAPTLKVFENSDITLNENKTSSSFLEKRGHLFGNYTKYINAKRMEPGSILYKNTESVPYIDLLSVEKIPPKQVITRFGSIINAFPKNQRHLPISGGMDSRLMLAAAQFSYGYCYGPKNSGDRPIARKFSNEFEHFIEFEFNKTDKNGDEFNVYEELCETPAHMIKTEFLACYRHASNSNKKANVIFDGYLGDTLQRGVWLYLGGILGEIYRFFPLLYTLKKVDAHCIFKRRYKNLSSREFELLFDDYTQRTSSFDLDDYAKVTYYEFLWGRGARFINNGALLINGQFGHVVPLFSDPVTFNSLIHEDFSKTIRFITLNNIWEKVDEKFKQVKFENGYKISTPNIVKPKLALAWRLLARYVPGFKNYGNS